MTFEEYQKLARKTAIYRDKDNNFIYPTLGLVGEAGEVAEKIKRLMRDKKFEIDDALREELLKELGDVLWYIANLASELDLSLEEVASLNIKKLSSRQKRNKLQGRGDNR